MEVLKISLWFVLTIICSLSAHHCYQVVFSLAQGAALCSHKVGTGKSGAGLVVTFITNNTIMCGGKVNLKAFNKNENQSSLTAASPFGGHSI